MAEEHIAIRRLVIQMTQNMTEVDETLARKIQDAVVENFYSHPQGTIEYLRNLIALIEQLKALDDCFRETEEYS